MQETLTPFCWKSFVICLTYDGSYSYSGFRFAFLSATIQGSYDTLGSVLA